MSRYVDELSVGIADCFPTENFRFVFWTGSRPPDGCQRHEHVHCDFSRTAAIWKIAHISWLELRLAFAVLRHWVHGNAVVVLELSQWLASPFWARRTLTIVHDLIPARERSLKGFYYRSILPWLLRRKLVCVSVSGATKELLASVQVKSTVVHPWVSPALMGDCPVEESQGGHYLFVGTGAPHKNLRIVLETLSQQENSSRRLLCVVPPRDVRPLKELAGSLRIQQRVAFVSNVSDADMRLLYRTAHALISPSLAEGFGMPLAEAMALGCPVACSDMPIYREVAGDAAVFFNPSSAEGLRAALRKLENDVIRMGLIAAGRKRAESFQLQVAVDGLKVRLQELLSVSYGFSS